MSALLNFAVPALAVALMLSLAALLAEQGSRLLKRPARWVWALAMVLTTALPLLLAAAPPGLPPGFPTSARQAASNLPLFDVTASAAGAASARIAQAFDAAPTAAGALTSETVPIVTSATLAGALWLLASLAVAAWLWAGHRQLALRQRQWRAAQVLGTPVLVAADAGPAVVGILRPRIVLPATLLATAPPRLASVIAHEQSHIGAGDPRLLGAMLVLLVLMPWQALLWWQLARLRRAIEIDCDARVLAAGHRLADYGAALVDCASARTMGAGVCAMAAPGAFLEQRLRQMMRTPPRWQRWAAPLILMLAGDVCLAAVAVSRAAPSATLSAPDPGRALLAGYYQVGFNRVAVVGVTASGLTMKVNLEREVALLAQSPDIYLVPASDLSVRFDRASHSLRFYQNGVAGDPAPKVAASAVEAADAFIAERVASQSALPTGAAIIARNLSATRFEQLHQADFTPEFLRMAEPMMARHVRRVASYGPVQEVRFTGVNRLGWDQYSVRYRDRTVHWAIWLDGQGRLAGAVSDDGLR